MTTNIISENGCGLSSKRSALCECLQEDECNNVSVVHACNVSVVHVSYAKRHFIEPLYWTKCFRLDIDVSGHRVIADVFTENQHYNPMYSKKFGLRHLFIIAKIFCYKVTKVQN